ncbi:hypothetical protein HPB49_026277 [Dermacentor silvarum]|nr:hypothetical protein HPB49_026277 [Dermacentor silvarum]
MADETPTLDPTSTPTPIELDEPEGEWTTPGKVRKPRLAARPSFDLHAVCVHLPALPSATSAQLLDILPAFIRAAKLPAHTYHHIELARRLLSVASIILAGRIYAVAPYLAAPTNSCRGVIHGIAPDATQEELLRDLDSYQADILLARRMGNTNSALITFAGMHVPFCVYYQRLEFRCQICPVRMQRHEACANAAKKQRLLHRQHWKSLNMSQPPVKPSNPSSISKVSPTPVIQPAPSAQPKPAEYHTPAPVKQYSPLQKPVHQVRCNKHVSRHKTNLETLISNRTQSLDNLNSTINKAFNDAPGPMEDKNHPFKRTHPTNWDLFRRCESRSQLPTMMWVDSLRRTRSQATTTTEANPPSDRADPHSSLWRRRKRLLSRIRNFLLTFECQVRALVTVDVRKAFDTLLHDAILSPSKTPAVDLDSTVTFLLFSALDKLSSDSGPRCPRPSRSPRNTSKCRALSNPL